MLTSVFGLGVLKPYPETSADANSDFNVETLTGLWIKSKQINFLTTREHDVGHREALLNQLQVTLHDMNFGFHYYSAIIQSVVFT
jgi:hypothetical protein